MYLTETHIVNKNHKFYKDIDILCFLSKNLYNKANYIIKQEYLKNKKYLNYYAINKIMIETKDYDYEMLPRKVSNHTLMLLDQNWKSFFKLIKMKDRKVGTPRYLNKKQGRFCLEYELGAISKKSLRNGTISLSKTNIEIKYQNKDRKIKVVRLIPGKSCHKMEIVYEKEIIKNQKLNRDKFISIDLGINNLMTITSNQRGFTPLVVNGRPLKSINQFYNKKRAFLQSKLADKRYNSHQIVKLTHKRNMKIMDYLHKSSKMLIDICLRNNIGNIILGYNQEWKQNAGLGKRNNQNFVQIPFFKLKQMIQYKSELSDINFLEHEESYTSICSFLDNEPVKKHDVYKGRRIRRGLFKSEFGKLINADVNGSYNIMKKVVPNVFSEGIEDVAVHPIKLN